MADDLKQMGRLAFREEGKYWNCYFCKTETMKGKLLLGSISRAAVRADVDLKNDFIALMRRVFDGFSEEHIGQKPVWKDPVPAPESDRSGTA